MVRLQGELFLVNFLERLSQAVRTDANEIYFERLPNGLETENRSETESS